MNEGPLAMRTRWRPLLLACMLLQGPRAVGAEPPGVVISHAPASSEIYIGSPSIAVLPDGTYVASHDEFGPKSTEFTEGITRLFRSTDRGQRWQPIATIRGAYWSTLFAHRGALYLIGTDKHNGNIVIRRSDDAGATWTAPTGSATGLLRTDGQYHCAPVPVLDHHGRVWRAFERRGPSAGGTSLYAGVLSAPNDADLLDATNWTSSNFLPSDPAWNDDDMGAWLEGNAVRTPAGRGILNILRVQTQSPDEKAAVMRVSLDGKQAAFDPAAGLVTFPGGAKKFTIRYDLQTKRSWSLASIVDARHSAKDPGKIRNTLALTSSPDLRHWTVQCILLYHPDVTTHGFQYVDWLIEGEDIIAACRTAWDDAEGGAHSAHDANYLTFHRFKDFRRL